MAYGNNRVAKRPQSSTQVAGGIVMKFRHPYLAGQISNASPVDEIDVSSCLKLNERFFSAEPAQENAIQEVMVDGSTITITNHSLRGKASLQVLQTTGFVGTGDLIAASHLIIASKDSVGGTLTIKQFINGKCRVTMFYDVHFTNVPHLILAGNAVVPYQMTMLYGGWVQGISGDTENVERAIWAVGNKYGLKAEYKPYTINLAETEGNPYTDDGVDSTSVYADDYNADLNAPPTITGIPADGDVTFIEPESGSDE